MGICPIEYIPNLLIELVSRITKSARADLQGRDINNWDSLKEHLRCKYKYQNTFDQLLDQLTSIEQKTTESSETYADQIRKLIWKAKEVGITEKQDVNYISKITEHLALN